MGHLWEMYTAYLAKHEPYPPSLRQVAKQLDLSPTALSNWEHGLQRIPNRQSLLRFADVIGQPYERVLDAALRDAAYLPEAAVRDAVTIGTLWSRLEYLLIEQDLDIRAAARMNRETESGVAKEVIEMVDDVLWVIHSAEPDRQRALLDQAVEAGRKSVRDKMSYYMELARDHSANPAKYHRRLAAVAKEGDIEPDDFPEG